MYEELEGNWVSSILESPSLPALRALDLRYLVDIVPSGRDFSALVSQLEVLSCDLEDQHVMATLHRFDVTSTRAPGSPLIWDLRSDLTAASPWNVSYITIRHLRYVHSLPDPSSPSPRYRAGLDKLTTALVEDAIGLADLESLYLPQEYQSDGIVPDLLQVCGRRGVTVVYEDYEPESGESAVSGIFWRKAREARARRQVAV